MELGAQPVPSLLAACSKLGADRQHPVVGLDDNQG
jgi:hypothetical protein